MRELPLPGPDAEPVVVDACGACGGLLVEFYDGEVSHVARAAVTRLEPPRVGASEGAVLCPDCDVAMELAPYLGDGPKVARCGGCMALFATHAQLEELARYEAASPAPRPPSALERALRALGLR